MASPRPAWNIPDGSLGSAIFSAAYTCDAFTDLVVEGPSADEATARLIAESIEILTLWIQNI